MTGNMYGSFSICTIGNLVNYNTRTVGETRKCFSTISAEKNNESASKNVSTIKRDEMEYVHFIKNDESLFARAISSDALKKAWFQLKSKPGMHTKGTNDETLSGISDF